MSRSERERSHVVRQVIANKVSQRQASERLEICVRQVKRLVRAYKSQGDAEDDKKIQDFNYRATKEAIARAVNGEPAAEHVVAQSNLVKHPFAPN